jgi:hypothetical protein|eukprot:COSAG02_NODE_2058_length_9977_cov_7.896639_4_plen_96_part_00
MCNFLAYYPAENLQDPMCVVGEMQDLSGEYSQPGDPDQVCDCSGQADKVNTDWRVSINLTSVEDDEKYPDVFKWRDGCHCHSLRQERAPAGSLHG